MGTKPVAPLSVIIQSDYLCHKMKINYVLAVLWCVLDRIGV